MINCFRYQQKLPGHLSISNHQLTTTISMKITANTAV